MTLPPIPREVMLPAGPYRVVRAMPNADPDRPGDTIYGHCDYETRVITIKPRMARAMAWLTLEHEIVHAILSDAGVKLSEHKEELVCDAIALTRVYRMRGGA